MTCITGWHRLHQDMITADQTAPAAVSLTRPSNLIITEGASGIRLRFLVGADAQTVTFALHAVDVAANYMDIGGQVIYMTVPFIAAGTAITGGTLGGVGSPDSGALVRQGEYFVDTIPDTATEQSGFLTVLIAHAIDGVVNEYSPADNTIAELLIRGIEPLYGITVTIAGISSESANCLYQLDGLSG